VLVWVERDELFGFYSVIDSHVVNGGLILRGDVLVWVERDELFGFYSVIDSHVVNGALRLL
jgi:hypothetical protein